MSFMVFIYLGPRKSVFHSMAIVGLVLGALVFLRCIDERCRENRDCPGVGLCNVTNGECYYECSSHSDCGEFGFHCVDHLCELMCEGDFLACPEGMASVCGSFCMDIYEASRPDATATQAGTNTSMAVSRAGVMPWTSGTLTTTNAVAACTAAGKRLCTSQEWKATCEGQDQLVYVYGNEYDPAICNSRDTYCDPDCGVYKDCYKDCPFDHHLMPAGSFPDCTNEFGVFDLSGNTWEVVLAADNADHFHGGAFDCGDPTLAHTCSYDGTAAGTFPATRGFRCCTDGEEL